MRIDTARFLIARGCIDAATIYQTRAGTVEIYLDGMPNENALLHDTDENVIEYQTINEAQEALRALGWSQRMILDGSDRNAQTEEELREMPR